MRGEGEETGHCEGDNQPWAPPGSDLALIRICPAWQRCDSKFCESEQHNSCQRKHDCFFGQNDPHCYWGWCKGWWGHLQCAVYGPTGTAAQKRWMSSPLWDSNSSEFSLYKCRILYLGRILVTTQSNIPELIQPIVSKVRLRSSPEKWLTQRTWPS